MRFFSNLYVQPSQASKIRQNSKFLYTSCDTNAKKSPWSRGLSCLGSIFWLRLTEVVTSLAPTASGVVLLVWTEAVTSLAPMVSGAILLRINFLA